MKDGPTPNKRHENDISKTKEIWKLLGLHEKLIKFLAEILASLNLLRVF